MESWAKLEGLQTWLVHFQNDMREVDVPNSNANALALGLNIKQVKDRLFQALLGKKDEPLTANENTNLRQSLENFEREFYHESRRLAVLAVTPKGDKDVRILLENAEQILPPELVAVLPANVLEDIREAGKCLAFERATACAFHSCRATEGLMRAYYKHLMKVDWPPAGIRPDWKVLVDQLKVNGAPPRQLEKLDDIRADRNSYAHPDVTVPMDEAPLVYATCNTAMFYIAKEMI